ncbi:hypothetical protein I4U23_029666 [Adineta vaga]|nr:hypothetical protein I4U23_029666 [Adineta vaga]
MKCDRLTNEIEKMTENCPQTIFIFDEIDQMSSQLLDVILYYIDFHTPTSSQSIDFRKTIFIFLSNIGGSSIIELANKNSLSSIKREDYNILEFQQILSVASSREQGGLQHAALVDRHLVTFFVPFLPLERKHIKNCIRQQLEIILDNDIYEYELSEEKIIDEVLNLIEFKTSSLEYSVSGCKKISQKLDFIFERIRPTLKKTKKQIDDIL